MTREEAHNLVDNLFDNEHSTTDVPANAGVAHVTVTDQVIDATPTRVLPEGKRVVRTKSSGDRVFLLDDNEKTRQWVTNEKVLASLGFEFSDVGEIEDDKLTEFRMAPALYRAGNE
jgi:hypothetical protein